MGNFGRFLLVFFFAGSVVVLGANELQQRYRARYGSRGEYNRNFFERIKEHAGVPRARLAPDEVSRATALKSAADEEARKRGDTVSGFVEKLVP